MCGLHDVRTPRCPDSPMRGLRDADFPDVPTPDVSRLEFLDPFLDCLGRPACIGTKRALFFAHSL
jgi:hypothetical protein